MNRYFVLVFFFLSQICLGQKFVYQSELKGGDMDGYRKIILPVEVYNKLNLRKTDIRIYNSDWEEVPYIWEGKSYWKEDSVSYDSIVGVAFTQRDYKSSKRSTVNITLPVASRIDKVEFEIEGPVNFIRSSALQFKNLDETKSKRKKRKENVQIQLISNLPLKYEIDEVKVKELSLQIDNEDNPPLKFKRVKIYQKVHSLVAYLEKGEAYKVTYGNKNLRSPRYDLDYFAGKIPDHLAAATISNIQKEKEAFEKEPPFYKRMSFIWATLLIVIFILGSVCFKMVREMKK